MDIGPLTEYVITLGLDPEGLVFVLAMLRHYPNAVERDLAKVYGVRYADRWRFDEDGHRRLTLREIWVLIEELPHDSSLVRATNEGQARWSPNEYLLADLFQVWTGKPHPARPKSEAQKQANAKRKRAERLVNQRFVARNRRVMAGSAKTPNGGDG